MSKVGEGNRGWVCQKGDVWEECTVKDNDATTITLVLADGTAKSFPKKSTKFAYRNPSSLDGCEDFLTLPHLDEPNILHSLRVRYEAGEVYSYTGPILIAVNPWRAVDLYSITVMQSYSEKRAAAPHIYHVANKAYDAMIEKRKSQCILIAGESGAGKTENTKKVLQVLTAAGENRTKSSASIEQQIMLTNPVLEGFGNAKTLRNDNSSRFGKWISVHFDRKGTIQGAAITTYLLEKARVTAQSEQERNYHIFYQCCKASKDSKMLQDLMFDDPSKFTYTSNWLDAMGQDDVNEFACTMQALQFIGFDEGTQLNVLGTLSGILHLGNLEIKEAGDGSRMEKNLSFDAVGTLLSVTTENLQDAICQRSISVGGEKLMKPETVDKAKLTRDALAKGLYNKLFNYVVQNVNQALGLQGDVATLQVSVLDIFGFEVFKANHFEQFCINFANEKLQLHFNHFNFMLERELYAREGIDFDASDFNDNSKCVELIEHQKIGLCAVLDDVCKTPKGDDTMFLERMKQSKDISGSKYFTAPKLGNSTFIIHHYAADVTYQIVEFCEKNKDAMAPDLVALMAASGNDFYPSLLADSAPAGTGTGAKKAAPTLSSVFKKDLQSLLNAIEEAEPHFVRCMNPNTVRKAYLFDPIKALEQLRCGGVIEAVRMARESYPTRLPHDDFMGSFAVVVPEGLSGDPKAACLKIVTHLKLPAKQYKLGSSMILLKQDAMEALEKEKKRLLAGRALCLQKSVRTKLAKMTLEAKRELRIQYTSVLLLQMAIRRCQRRTDYIKDMSSGGVAAGGGKPSLKKAGSFKMVHGVDTRGLLEGFDDIDEETLSPHKDVEIESILVEEAVMDEMEIPPICIVIYLNVKGHMVNLKLQADTLAYALKKAMSIKDHHSFLKIHPKSFRGTHMISWLRDRAARALFGPHAQKVKNQELSIAVARMVADRLMVIGVLRPITGSLSKPLDDSSALFRFHEDEREGPMLNCRSIWYKNARPALVVVSELLNRLLDIVKTKPGESLKDSPELEKFTEAAGELQMVNTNDLNRVQLLAFFINAYNLMSLHGHLVRDSFEKSDFKPIKLTFTHDNHYMIAAYPYCLSEIEERLFCRVLRAKFPVCTQSQVRHTERQESLVHPCRSARATPTQCTNKHARFDHVCPASSVFCCTCQGECLLP